MERTQAEQPNDPAEQPRKIVLHREIPLLVRDILAFPLVLAPHLRQELKAYIARLREERAAQRKLDDEVE